MNHRSTLSILLLALLASGPIFAQTMLLSDPVDFSGEETVFTFDDLGLSFGGPVPMVEGVEFILDDGTPSKFLMAPAEREFGSPGLGSINNFTFYSRPYSDLHVLFPESVRRVGFELRANTLDTVTVSLFSGGTQIDEILVPNRGGDKFYFYGFENAAGFDEVLIDVGPLIGSLSLDNLSFESGAESAEVLACDGFESKRDLRDRWKSRDGRDLRRWWHAWRKFHPRLKSQPLVAKLRDANGLALTDADLTVAPRVRVIFSDSEGGEPVDVTDAVFDETSNEFMSTEAGDWWSGLPRRTMREHGTYEITMESGDESAYVIEPTCSQTIVRIRHPGHWHHRDHRSRGRRSHHDD